MQSRIKVWYKSVGVQRVAHAARWAVTLDGRALQTPAKSPLELPTEAMAWAVAMEWQAQGKFLQPYTMPLMKLATTSIDQVPSIRPQMASSMLRTMHTDVVALRADAEDEPELAAKEAAAYDPLISWLADAEGVQLNATSSLVVEQEASETLPRRFRDASARRFRETSATLPRRLRSACEPLSRRFRHFRDAAATLPRHRRDTAATLPRHFRGTSATLPRHSREA